MGKDKSQCLHMSSTRLHHSSRTHAVVPGGCSMRMSLRQTHSLSDSARTSIGSCERECIRLKSVVVVGAYNLSSRASFKSSPSSPGRVTLIRVETTSLVRRRPVREPIKRALHLCARLCEHSRHGTARVVCGTWNMSTTMRFLKDWYTRRRRQRARFIRALNNIEDFPRLHPDKLKDDDLSSSASASPLHC